ncbi:adenosylcobinamide-GDP ribazoletransferase [Pseudonocardia asaccharolytica]|uniref:Adenosylcobinamide-GDP ribazoletransferase n=1 Tax=Pseudonocardia asaccharolytica DSM 44247 = NBRC 16224 TaxID=1123024 RepID=A0A511D0X8_9PSEU|nr:adenosylcobinamide-GDP ribazoletransferase [Pseudonocardia asaccharolytica]GEL18462.1 adenosylcobinamide-GDP ribazoletransferase [Pseudonocardia asaccharolytica DSM 44247 = NBRC 16224]
MRGLALALSWLTVLPVRAVPLGSALDPRTAAAAIRWAPVVGGLIGGGTGAVVLGLTAAGVPPLVGGLLAAGAAALATRGMHLDGLADTADGLGCYGPPERALTVMREGGAGPFAVVTLLVVVGTQAAALAALATAPVATLLAAAGLSGAVGRAGFAWCARRGVPAARPGGLGSTVAGSQPVWVAVAWWAVLACAAAFAVPGRWLGPLAVGLAAVLVVGLSWHTRRRFGGMTGDVLGAASELGGTAALVVLATG